MTMSTYKSLGGPAGGLMLTNDASLAQRIDAIAYPGLTANFDVAKSAALAIGLLDWREYGPAYARMMVETAKALATALDAEGVPIFLRHRGFTSSHQFAVEAARFGGGQAAAKRLRQANILASGIGLPVEPVAGDLNGLRLGTPEIVRWGMEPEHMPKLASLIARGLLSDDPGEMAPEVSAFRRKFTRVHFVR
jgi:glycine hydroxymethyltransferase